ncbi:sensor histidine kinase [Thalassovita mangrovi]|uniref:histidine kinase n=1 Tax=Thalassovita mangrovi TaxID=2692236 RepID=A0A6L8LEG8_9RHOB|nr:HAMP domain-containing sensor histidine kinase [Thalassovita mangrovi]MYM54457.1 hypothetical protein [Thalassovita mangrovi]
MDRGSVFSGGSFRATLYGTLVFILTLAVVGVLANHYIKTQLRAEIRMQVEATIADLQSIHDIDGPDALMAAVANISPLYARAHLVVALRDAAGNTLSGLVDAGPGFEGWTTRQLALPGQSDFAGLYYLTSVPVGDFELIVGQNIGIIDSMEATTLRVLLAVGAVMTLVFITIGYRMGRAMQVKLEKMADTLETVAAGDTDARLPVSAENDQIDRVSRTMNLHLSRLSDLMVSTKSSAAAIAHDLKRPLARSYLQLERAIAKAEAGADPLDDLEETRHELSRLSDIFETILRIARIEAGQAEGVMQRVDLAEMAADLGETFEVVAEESGQSLSLWIDRGQDLSVRGDAGMLSQMIVNLLQNAVSHCPKGTQITLGVGRVNRRVCLEVADNGPGIPDTERENALLHFFRADASRSSDGTGLGLALVKTIADRHGVELRLADNGPGLRVTACFPAPE